ncbi:sensor histidine kinase [Microlunatus soli]|uniref:sensor histidine kinase n=1 Tax=Microlunatus soli TaxID=630515 RepID=UPI0012FAD7F8|nr:sensor histidine kinase [Microlunatus soli]
MRPPFDRLLSMARPVVGVGLGAVSWPVDLVAAIVTAVLRGGRMPLLVSGWQCRRVQRWIGFGQAAPPAPTSVPRSVGYLLTRVPIGLLAAVVLGLLLYGCWAVVAVLGSWLFDLHLPVADSVATVPVRSMTVAALVPVGLILLFLDLTGIAGVAALDRLAAEHWFRPTRSELLQRRVEELTVSRHDLIRALDSERSRIERDLHDGIQQRVVALGLLVGRARRQLEPQQAGSALLEQAQREAADLLDDLRDVAWRVSPATLESEGLAAALHRLAEQAGTPVTVHWAAPTRLPAAVESCVFHLVSEALTNVARHARATRTDVRLDGPTGTASDRRLSVRVTDDGVGGAVPRPGHGLAGLTGRVEAAGGTLSISSPPSGPTRLEAVLPCT